MSRQGLTTAGVRACTATSLKADVVAGSNEAPLGLRPRKEWADRHAELQHLVRGATHRGSVKNPYGGGTAR